MYTYVKQLHCMLYIYTIILVSYSSIKLTNFLKKMNFKYEDQLIR